MGDAVRSVADLRFDWQGKTLMKSDNKLGSWSRCSPSDKGRLEWVKVLAQSKPPLAPFCQGENGSARQLKWTIDYLC
jgi:hypothetical protein